MNDEKRKKLDSWLSITFAIALAVSLAWGAYEYQLLQEYKVATENQYKRSFNVLVTSLNGVETSIAKAKVANSPALKALYMGETWKGCSTAVSNLGQLPADELGINYVDTVINQVGDFSKTMTRKVASGEVMTAKELALLNDMHDRIIDVNRATQQLSQQVYSDKLAWVDKPEGLLERMGFNNNNNNDKNNNSGENETVQTAAQGEESEGKEGEGQEEDKAKQEEQKKPSSSVRSGLNQLSETLQKHPPFDYEGEMDDHYVEKPLGLPKEKIDEKKAISVAKEFLQKVGYKDASPELSGQSQGPMGGFNFKYNDTYMEVTKQGGIVTIYRDQRENNERKLGLEETVGKAKEILKKLGWSSMVITTTQDLGGTFQIDAVLVQGSAKVYPDKLRLIIATDNGQLVGFDSTPYYAFHHSREFNSVLSLEEASAKLDKNFQVKESSMAVIAKIGTQEAYCYEFVGTSYGEEYIVYINATNGAEEKISRVIQTPRGKLLQ